MLCLPPSQLLGQSVRFSAAIFLAAAVPTRQLASAERFGTGGMSRTFFPVRGVTENADAQNRRVHLWWQSIQLFALGLRPPAAGRVGGKEQLLLQPNLNQEFQYNNTGFQSYQLLVRAGLSSERANQSFCDD